MADISDISDVSATAQRAHTDGTADMRNTAYTALTELQVAIRLHPELTDSKGFTLLALVEGLLGAVALIGSLEDLLDPLQKAMNAVGWMTPLVRENVRSLAGRHRYLPLGDLPGQVSQNDENEADVVAHLGAGDAAPNGKWY